MAERNKVVTGALTAAVDKWRAVVLPLLPLIPRHPAKAGRPGDAMSDSKNIVCMAESMLRDNWSDLVATLRLTPTLAN